MKKLKIGEKFQLQIKEKGFLTSENLEIELDSVSRLRPPRLADQFILQIHLLQGKEKKELNLDGEFRFPSTTISIKWNNYIIYIRDIDYMASYVQFQIEKI